MKKILSILLMFVAAYTPVSAHGLALGLGLGAGYSSGRVIVEEFTLSSSLPTGFTVTRSGSNATARNASGVWSVVAANTARFHMLNGDTETGLLVEPSRVNKTTAYNASPTDLTNITVGGNASASVTVVSDSSALTTDGINLGNGNVIDIDNTLGGSGSAHITFSGSYGNTNAHSMSTFMKVVTGTNACGFVGDSGGANTKSGSTFSTEQGGVDFTAGYERLWNDNITTATTTRTMRISVNINCKVRFILWQFEEGEFSTTPIITAGASATRAVDRVQATNLTTAFGNAWNQSRGTLGIQVRSTRVYAADQIFSQFSDNSTNNVIGMRLYHSAGNETGFVRNQIVAGGSTQSAVSVTKILANRDFPMAIAWGNGAYKTMGGAGRTRRETGKTLPSTTLTRFDLTTRHNGSSPFYGVIKKLFVANQVLPNARIGALLMDSGAKGIITAGQSIVDNHRRSQVELDNAGEVSFISTLDSVWTGSVGNNWMLHGAVGGSAVLEKHAGATGSYYDNETGEFKSVYTVWKDTVDFFQGGGGTVEAIVWDGAQQDASAGAFATPELTEEEYDGHVTVWTQMRDILGDVPIIISPTTGRTDTEAESYQSLKELQWRLADDLAYVYRGAESFDLPKASGDPIHLSSAGYQTKATREARKALKVLGETITGGVDGASIVSAVRTGTSVVVTLDHDEGTDFVPTTGIRGFRAFDDTTPITISSAVRTNATTITLTLAGTPSGTFSLYYGYASLYAEAGAYADLVQDNGTPAMPLRGYSTIYGNPLLAEDGFILNTEDDEKIIF